MHCIYYRGPQFTKALHSSYRWSWDLSAMKFPAYYIIVLTSLMALSLANPIPGARNTLSKNEVIVLPSDQRSPVFRTTSDLEVLGARSIASYTSSPNALASSSFNWNTRPCILPSRHPPSRLLSHPALELRAFKQCKVQYWTTKFGLIHVRILCCIIALLFPPHLVSISCARRPCYNHLLRRYHGSSLLNRHSRLECFESTVCYKSQLKLKGVTCPPVTTIRVQGGFPKNPIRIC